MGSQRAHIVLPESLIRDIDALVGPRARSAFLVETAQAEIHRRKLLKFLETDEPVWKDDEHPELSEGSSDWVRSLRQEGQNRTGSKSQSDPA